MHSQARDSFGHNSRTARKLTRQKFLAVTKKKRPRINKIHKAIKPLGHLRAIGRGQERFGVEFEEKVSISVIGDGFTFLARLSHEPYNGEEGLKIKTRDYRRRHGHYLK